jgi:fructokinase
MTQKTKRKGLPSQSIVVGTGLLALDAVTSADSSIPVRYWAGGTCGNVLIALSYLGWTAQPIARLAKDNATELLLSDLRQWKVSDRFIRVEKDGSTPIIVQRITRDSEGRVRHSFSWRCTSCGARYPGYKPELLTVAEAIAPKLNNVSVFFFDRVSAASLLLAKAAAESGAVVAFEPSGIGNPIQFRQAWEIAHIVKYSHERLSDFPELDVDTNPQLVIETLGDAGLRYRRSRGGSKPGSWIESKAIAVDLVQDTAGSGDWCTAGLLAKIAAYGRAGLVRASDQEIANAIKYGQALAAWNCQFEGARGGMYAVTHKQFQKQIEELLSGDKQIFHFTKGSSVESDSPKGVCRVCDHSVSDKKKRRSDVK